VSKRTDAGKSQQVALAAVCLCLSVLILGSAEDIRGQGWSELKVRLLSRSAFAVIENAEGGRTIKHCPHHDHNGDLDIEQLIYVLGTFERETWFDSENRKIAKKHLTKHYDVFSKRIGKEGLKDKLSINTSKLTDLVRLPHVGPVLAVRIVEYRNAHSRFRSIEDLREIDGIGGGTFDSIRHYVRL